MNSLLHRVSRRRWGRAVTALVLMGVLVGVVPASAAARQTGTPPTITAIWVNSFNCDTGALDFRATVANLPHVPASTSAADYPLVYSYTARYAQGPDISPAQANILSPTAQEAPYSGDVFLALTVPTTNDLGTTGPSGPIDSIVLRVSVGYGGAGMGADGNPTASRTLTYFVNCDGGDADLATQLIAALKRVLRDALAVG